MANDPAELYPPNFHVVLYQPEIPPNTGAVGRTCVAAGSKLWLVRPLGFRIDEKTRRRAGLDYWQYLNWEVVDHWEQLCTRLAPERMWFLTKRANQLIHDAPIQNGDIFVFGSETSGLPDSLLTQFPGRALRIPTRAAVRSLNLSCSVAITLYEALRQTQQLPR